ncbi:MAG: hypothetical protein JSV49_09220 [Thermoplasmata archaeon]|nr:MAG: hypothetical protein JSV49_09220 [Thermoplasmata archaeon]
MRVGDKDGLDDIYNEDGELILKEDEEVIVKEENIVPSLKTTWRKFGGEDVIESMNGTVYLTTRRFVFIATPENIGRISSESGGGLKSFGVDMGPVGQVKAVDQYKGTRDYFELLVKELLACEIQAGVVSSGEQINAYVMAAGKQYSLRFLGKEDSALLKKFKNNTVESVDELVENLKKYYENSDWIHS